MKYLLLDGIKLRVLPVLDNRINEAESFFKKLRYKVTEIKVMPSARTLRRWKATQKARAIDGCIVNGLSSCLHGCRSWLAVKLNQG